MRDTCINLERLLPSRPPHITCAAGYALPLRNARLQELGVTASADVCEAACSAERSCVAFTWHAHNGICALGSALGSEPDQGAASAVGPAWWAAVSCVNVSRMVSPSPSEGSSGLLLQYDGQWLQCGKAETVSKALVSRLMCKSRAP